MTSVDMQGILAHQNYSANFERLVANVSGQPRYSTYLTSWRVSFGALTEDQMPRDMNGLSTAKWRAVVHYYTANQMPQVGDRLYNLRYSRTSLLMGERFTVVMVQKHPMHNTVTLLLTESSTL